MNVLVLMESVSTVIPIRLVAITVHVLLAINSVMMGITALVSVATM